MYELRRALSSVFDAIEQVSIFKNNSDQTSIDFHLVDEPIRSLEISAQDITYAIIDTAKRTTKSEEK